MARLISALALVVVLVAVIAIGFAGQRDNSTLDRRELPGVERWAQQTANVRSAPRADAPVIKLAPRGISVRTASVAGAPAWLAILSGQHLTDTAGYVMANLLAPTPPPPARAQRDVAAEYDAPEVASAAITSAPRATPRVSIETWRWYPEPKTGHVVWTAVVRNGGSSYIQYARVEFTTFDADGGILDTDFAFAEGLTAGGTAAVKGYATYTGREKRATLRAVD